MNSLLSKTPCDRASLFVSVWGYLKYFHPAFCNGSVCADQEFFSNIDLMKQGTIDAKHRKSLADWINRLPIPAPSIVHISVDKSQPDWLSNEELLGGELSRILLCVHKHPIQKNYYLSVKKAGNPECVNEPDYPTQSVPPLHLRQLAMARIWSAIEYLAPHRALTYDWYGVIPRYLPSMKRARSALAYHKTLLRISADVQDGHALLSGIGKYPLPGALRLPFTIRFIDNKAIVELAFNDAVSPGDAIVAIDDESVEDMIKHLSQYTSAGRHDVVLRNIARLLPRGTRKKGIVTLERNGRKLTVPLIRRNSKKQNNYSRTLARDNIQYIENTLYLKFEGSNPVDIEQLIEQVNHNRSGLIVDLRCYPLWGFDDLTTRIKGGTREFARFGTTDPLNPGTMKWPPAEIVNSSQTVIDGRVAVLIDNSTQSHAEYFAMAIASGKDVKLFGEPSAGADGNMSVIGLPGGLNFHFTGLDVRWPDMTPTQQIGLIPDQLVTTTRNDIINGRDPVIQSALSWVTKSVN